MYYPRDPFIYAGIIDATAGAADAALGVTERKLATVESLDNVVVIKIPKTHNAIELRFLMTTNGANAVIDVWMGRADKKGNAALTRACSLDVECGLQDTENADYPHFADEITVTNDDWLKVIASVQSANDSDLMARLPFDTGGYGVVVLHSHTTCAENVRVEYSGYNS